MVFKEFCADETDISVASRSIKEKEKKLCDGVEYIYIPIAFDALTVVLNTQNQVTSMTIDELKEMWSADFQSSVSTWKDVKTVWSDAKLVLYAPGADFGTFDYFSGTIANKNHRTDITVSEDDNILVQGLARPPNAIAYFGYAYYEANKDRLKAVAIDNGNGPVLPSREAVESGTKTPLSRPIFIYVNKKAA